MTAPARIGYLVSQYPAASHTFIRREIEALRLRGIDIATYSIRRPSDAEAADSLGKAATASTHYVLPMSPVRLVADHFATLFTAPVTYARTLACALGHRAPGLRAFFWALFHFAEAIVLARQLRRDGITHLHNHFANSGATVGMLAARIAKLPWSLTLHGISETDYPAGLTLARKIAAAKFVACVSWFGRAQALRITPPEQWSKMSVVRCGVDLAALPFTAPVGTAIERIVCVGRLSPEKGHFGLLEAFARVAASRPALRLVLVGDGPEREAITGHATALDIADKVTFAGRLDEAATLAQIARADLLVLASFMEGLPIVLMEAMALGTPVIASHVAGVPELITHGIDGFLFTPGDFTALGDCIARVIDNPAACHAVALAARARIEQEFDIAHAVEPLHARFAGS